ncbi:unnamed protein product [Tilletia controversa]|uniref:Uncharacterized protein n=3 Tax=Tilletia TaxID=13289 RepID=A0A8X7MPE4_9BASI|nr:hypothetical protein CF336_g5935 [Tilletia laevis]KAE8192009.1 hypothetical protein CF328_g5509 [Tilletia controversa]KAE8261397.1 hypothetical protein A4X03_0g3290 [Tilletia caries]KAE8195057.1 hypothetical protein CF335_g5186 [Tilletia laevis]KAE8243377.1 hypothetical protein A4X06_0g6361 [Tilletia controversa]
MNPLTVTASFGQVRITVSVSAEAERQVQHEEGIQAAAHHVPALRDEANERLEQGVQTTSVDVPAARTLNKRYETGAQVGHHHEFAALGEDQSGWSIVMPTGPMLQERPAAGAQARDDSQAVLDPEVKERPAVTLPNNKKRARLLTDDGNDASAIRTGPPFGNDSRERKDSDKHLEMPGGPSLIIRRR